MTCPKPKMTFFPNMGSEHLWLWKVKLRFLSSSGVEMVKLKHTYYCKRHNWRHTGNQFGNCAYKKYWCWVSHRLVHLLMSHNKSEGCPMEVLEVSRMLIACRVLTRLWAHGIIPLCYKLSNLQYMWWLECISIHIQFLL